MDIFLTNQTFEQGITRSYDGGSFGPIHRSHLGLWIMLKGNLNATVAGKHFEVIRGQSAFMYAQKVHELHYTSKEVEYIWCGTSFTTDPGFFALEGSIKQLLSMPNVLKPSKLLNRLLQLGVETQNRRGVAAQRVRNTLGESAFNEYFYLANVAEEESIMPNAVIKSKAYISQNYSSPGCRLSDIAEAAALSPQHLTKLFKLYMQCTPVKYLWQLRGEKAIHMLKYSNLNISEIAARCGFKDPYHFSRHIHKQYGYSPREIRKRH